MKTNALLFLLLFSVFIIAPAVISICDADADIIEFSMGEEEKTDSSLTDSEKQLFEAAQLPESINTGIQKNLPTLTFELIWDTWYPETISPPPESTVL